ncbi:MAG: hypothetical protein JO129_03530 [Candidatus Dependentiae bacterium]|nr:hypothetical protein [Candidatus Dependentiae bacterium]
MKKLTQMQAFNAMSKLFNIYYKQTRSDDLGGILGSMSFVSEKRTADPAMWEIWIESLEKKDLIKHDLLTTLEAFLAVGCFLEEYFGTTDLESPIDFLELNINNAENKKHVDSALWNNWLKCIDEVLSVKDARDYLKLS